MDFLQKPLAWFSKFYLRVQSKNCGGNGFFLFFFSDFFSNFERKLLRILAKKLLEVFKTTFYVLRGTVCGLNFFLKIWIVLGFLQKPLAWFSKFYLRVQSKNSGRNRFFILLFTISSDSEWKFFSDFWLKNFKKFSKLPSTCSEEQFVAWIFLKASNRFGFSAETFGMVLKFISSCPE